MMSVLAPKSKADLAFIMYSLSWFATNKVVAIEAEINVLYKENKKTIIGQYIIFSKVYNEQRKQYGNTRQAVTEIIRICKDRNVLKEYLESKEQEDYLT